MSNEILLNLSNEVLLILPNEVLSNLTHAGPLFSIFSIYFTLILLRFSTGAEARIGCTIVQIQLVNVVDTVPIFSIYSQTVQISEKSLSGRFIYQLTSNGEEKQIFFYNTTKTDSNA